MSTFRSFVTAFCAATVFAGGVELLCPKGRMTKTVKYALSVFMLFCIVSAALLFTGTKIKLDTPSVNIEKTDMSALAARQTFAEALRRENIEFSEITVCTDKSDDGSISITEVTVYTSESEERITEIIGSDDYDVRIVYE